MRVRLGRPPTLTLSEADKDNITYHGISGPCVLAAAFPHHSGSFKETAKSPQAGASEAVFLVS
jgi:hypothetical protein